MSHFGKFLALTFFVLLFFFSWPVFAQEQYFFQEEFNLERETNALDSTRWVFFPNNQTCALATIKESNGFMNLQECNNKPRFPYVYTKTNPFPNGDFEVAIKFQYTKITPWGTGFAIVDRVPENGQWISDYLFSVGTWQDRSLSNMRISFDGNDIYTSPINLDPHEIKLSRNGEIYKIHLDGNLIFTSPPFPDSPKAIWFGNPLLLTFNVPEWTNSRIDYVRVKQIFPPGPQPFLDLPWNYEDKGMTFNEAATSIGSFFDHEYPLLSTGLSLAEPAQALGTLIDFYGGSRSNVKPYSKHDGYDYANKAKVKLGVSLLSAADGEATYMNSCGACGNAILIDHKNGYQTRYYHLQSDGLITNQPGQKVNVTKGQQIGKVGFSGNVSPSGETGSHLHFMVIQDKNNDGNFEDNIPDGITDPFGWQSAETDPWEIYSFNYAGQQRTGNKSYYLFTKQLDNLSSSLSSNARVFEVGKAKFDFPEGATDQDLNITVKSEPNFVDNILNSLGSIINIEAKDSGGNPITSFLKNFHLTINFSQFDLSRFNLDTLSIYSSQDRENWTQEDTQVDLNNKTAATSLNHLTYFALMAERKDILSPATTVNLQGQKGTNDNFRSDVSLSLTSQDNEGGLGVEFTAYSIDESNWQTYSSPLSFSEEGNYKVYFYSQDNDGNIEEIKSVEFSIDKTIPEAKIFIDLDKMDLVVEGLDENGPVVQRQDNPETKKKDDAVYLVKDLAGNLLSIDVRDRDKDKKDRFRVHSLQYNNASPVFLDKNFFNIDFSGKKEKLNVREQNFELKGETKIRIQYDAKKDQSKIITKDMGSEKVKEIKEGLVLLYLMTNEGKLEYGY